MSPTYTRGESLASLSFDTTTLEPCPTIRDRSESGGPFQPNAKDFPGENQQEFTSKHQLIRRVIGEACEEQLGLDKSYAWQNAKETTQPLRTDYRKGRRLIAGASLCCLAGAQAIGSLRLPLLLAPHYALKLGEEHHPVVAGVVLGSFYAAWNCTSAEVLRNAMSQHPNTVNQVANKASKAVDLCENSLPGLEVTHKLTDGHETDGLIVRGYKKTGSFLRLGYTAIGVGVNPFVATAQMKKRPRSEIRKIYTKGSLASGAAAGLTMGGVAVGVPELAKISTGAAELIKDGSENPVCLFGAAVILIAAPKLKTRLKTGSDARHRARGYEQIARRSIPQSRTSQKYLLHPKPKHAF